MNQTSTKTLQHLSGLTSEEARKVFLEILSDLKAYADKYGLTIIGFDDTFTEALFLRADTHEAIRVPYKELLDEITTYAT